MFLAEHYILSHGKCFHCNQLPAAAAKSLQSCPTLCDPIDSSPPGSSVPGILQARTLEWVAIAFSNQLPTQSYIPSHPHQLPSRYPPLSVTPEVLWLDMSCNLLGNQVGTVLHGLGMLRLNTSYWSRGNERWSFIRISIVL